MLAVLVVRGSVLGDARSAVTKQEQLSCRSCPLKTYYTPGQLSSSRDTPPIRIFTLLLQMVHGQEVFYFWLIKLILPLV